MAGCSSSPPTGPTPGPQPPVTPPPTVTPPVIKSLTVGATRAEVDRDVPVTAVVEDAEKAPSALTYVWTASIGTVTGTGAAVTWRLPRASQTVTPVNVTITLTVVEPYQALQNGQLVAREHRVMLESQPFRVHDSIAEVSRISLRFLKDLFGNSSITDPDACLIDFSGSAGCANGRAAERSDIVSNRKERFITSVDAEVQSVTFNSAMTTGTALVRCAFHDLDLSTSKPFSSQGNCILETVYHSDRWWLCSSEYRDIVPTIQGTGRRQGTVSGYWQRSGGN